MTTDKTQEIIDEIIQNMNAIADTPCSNTDCAYCDGECARKICGGYRSKVSETATRAI